MNGFPWLQLLHWSYVEVVLDNCIIILCELSLIKQWEKEDKKCNIT